MTVLVTGITGFVGAALVPRLQSAGHPVRGFARSPERVARAGVRPDELVLGDAVAGTGLDRALEGVTTAYYLIHSMEGPAASFEDQERSAADRFAAAAARAGVERIVYLGGLVPHDAPPSRHLASRLAVEAELLAAVPGSVAFRASIVIGARSRSFRFLVRLIERLPVIALPAWRDNRTQPIDGRDMVEFLLHAASAPAAVCNRSWDIGGPDVLSYGDMIERIADGMLVARPRLPIDVTLTPIASVIASVVAGEDLGLIGPLMESLEHDLLPA